MACFRSKINEKARCNAAVHIVMISQEISLVRNSKPVQDLV